MNLKSPEYVGGHDLIKGKSVLITAAAGAGIGFSAATKAAEEGARAIVLSDIHEGRLAAAVEKLKQESGLAEVYGKMGNVAVEEDVRSLVDFAEENMGGVDILINNAGLGSSKLLIEMEDDEWNRVIDVTLNGTMRMTRYMMKVMKARGQGGVDEEHVRLRVAVPQIDPLARGRQRGVGGRRWAGRRAAGRGLRTFRDLSKVATSSAVRSSSLTNAAFDAFACASSSAPANAASVSAAAALSLPLRWLSRERCGIDT